MTGGSSPGCTSEGAAGATPGAGTADAPGPLRVRRVRAVDPGGCPGRRLAGRFRCRAPLELVYAVDPDDLPALPPNGAASTRSCVRRCPGNPGADRRGRRALAARGGAVGAPARGCRRPRADRRAAAGHPAPARSIRGASLLVTGTAARQGLERVFSWQRFRSARGSTRRAPSWSSRRTLRCASRARSWSATTAPSTAGAPPATRRRWPRSFDRDLARVHVEDGDRSRARPRRPRASGVPGRGRHPGPRALARSALRLGVDGPRPRCGAPGHARLRTRRGRRCRGSPRRRPSTRRQPLQASFAPRSSYNAPRRAWNAPGLTSQRSEVLHGEEDAP